MDDLVKRLEHGCILEEDSGCEIDQLATNRVMAEAAKRIEVLETLLKKLNDKFSSYKPYFGAEHSCHVNISFALIEEIRAAIAREKKDD